MVSVNREQVARFARFLKTSGAARPFNFCDPGEGTIFPRRDNPGVLDYFFFCTAHQFGFWHLVDGKYDRPMISEVDGVAYKGSDYIWRCATKAWSHQNDIFSPENLPHITVKDWYWIFANDEWTNPLPLWEENMAIIRSYTGWFRRYRTSPAEIVTQANYAENPLARFLEMAGDIPGYCEDPLRKKLYLLAIILENRPEAFLKVTDPESYGPIIDYHLQRSCLRTGLVVVEEPALRQKLIRRETVSRDEEQAVREASFEVIEQLVQDSGAPVSAIDYFFFMNRERCPEMEPPKCERCPVNEICAKDKELFQPVFRTTYY